MNHLWQSTVFALVAGLLTLALRRNRAQVRYWIWFSASCKFLVPFALLMSLGRLAPVPPKAIAPVMVSVAVEEITKPFPETLPIVPTGRRSIDWLRIVWACGFAAVAWVRFRGWLRVQAAIRAGAPCDIPVPVSVRSSPGLIEPGVVGWWRPTLLLPTGIEQLLTPSQLEAVLAHELCHVRRRDNLFAAIHMTVEAIFWFHPLVWWIGARLVEERERACDEEVLRMGNAPHDYAEAILNVCKLYVESPLVCVSGVTGANLKKRIEAIMRNRMALELNSTRKLALAVLGMAALSLPVIVGALNVPVIRAAQNATKTNETFDVASVKVNDRGGRTLVQALPGRLVMTNFALRRLILFAYGVQDYQLLGDPLRAVSDSYDIEAKAEGTTSVQEMEGPMLQALLQSRFRLTLHRETRQLPIYELTVAKGGAKLTPSKDGSCVPYRADAPPAPVSPDAPHPNYCGFRIGADGANRTLDGTGVSMAQLASNLSRTYNSNLGRNVMDATGLSGVFDVHLKWAMDDLTAAGPISSDGLAPTPIGLSTALQEQLALRLESAKGAVEVLVIDHVERPSAN